MRLWIVFLCCMRSFAQDLLPNTTHLDFPSDMPAEQFAELRAFYERRIAAGPERAGTREDLRTILGAVDATLPPKPETQVLGESGGVRYSLIEWPISRIGKLDPTAGGGWMVRLYAVLLEPAGSGSGPATIAIADATHSAADIAGLTNRLPVERQFARTLARQGHLVVAPFFIQRRAFTQPWLDDRVRLMRMAFQSGHHPIGSETQQVSSIVDYLLTHPRADKARIAVAGEGQGGMTALFAGALDERIAEVISTGYLEDTTRDWDQPEDRALWRFRSLFRNEDLAKLIAPRKLTTALPASATPDASHPPQVDPERLAAISNHSFAQWQAFYRNVALETDRVRNSQWKPDYASPAAYERSMASKREAYFDLIGRYPKPAGAIQARSLKLYDEPRFTGYRLSVNVYPQVHAYGILLVPKGIQPGEKRPVVFVQHGLAGVPEDALGVVANPKADNVYMRFGMRLAERGYIVFAPMIATQSNQERQKLIRRCFLTGLIPAGMDVQKFNRVLDYLTTVPFVDANRFAFYGLSYGGYTAMWTGPGVSRFRVVISSGHFNDWATKTVDPTIGTSFTFYPSVLDQYNFGLLNRLDYSDLASLIAPRAFMIEMGDRDSVIVEPRHTVNLEIEQALEPFRKLGMPERGSVARFNGPHRIDGAESYPFLDRHLNWTPRN